MKSRLEDRVIDFLTTHSPQRFTVAEIANALVALHPELAREKQSRRKQRSEATGKLRPIQSQIGAEISRGLPHFRIKHPDLHVLDVTPRQLYVSTEAHSRADSAYPTDIFTTVGDMVPNPGADAIKESLLVTEESAEPLPGQAASLPLEVDLYPFLQQFMANRLGLYARRVDERRSKNSHGKNGNVWLHPDIVGLENLAARWHTLVKDCVKEEGGKRARIWSFEVKRALDMRNVRKYFYQAVSNSSWAHYGYLVAVEIDDLAMEELRILSATHGIGVILLDPEDAIEGSVIRLPARERPALDWSAWNRIAVENEDMRIIIRRLQKFLQSGEIDASHWDLAPPNTEEPGAPKPAVPKKKST